MTEYSAVEHQYINAATSLTLNRFSLNVKLNDIVLYEFSARIDKTIASTFYWEHIVENFISTWVCVKHRVAIVT